MSVQKIRKKLFGSRHQLEFDDKRPGVTKTATVGATTVSVGPYTYGYKAISVRQWNEGANLSIGRFCSIAKGLTVMTGGNHRIDWITTFPFGRVYRDEIAGHDIVGHPATRGDVVIGNDVWLGENVTLMSGITIGDGAVIAANATVVKDVGAYEIWGGNPATKIRLRFAPEIVERLQRLQWWTLPIEQINQIAAVLSSAPEVEVLDGLIAEYAR